MSLLSDKAIEIAVSQIGQQEKPLGSNWGHPVQDYLARVGINFPASWCMAFVYWCYDEAAKQLSVPNPLIKTGGVLHGWQESDEIYKFTSDPQPGDIGIMDFGGGLGHCFIIRSLLPNSILDTIEGNSNNNGSREGIEVEEKKIRHAFDKRIIGFLRY